MKVLLAVHGWPPELSGGTELATRDLARALAAAGHEVVVVAGSLERAAAGAGEVELRTGVEREGPDGPALRVHRLLRPDLYFDHWHKSLSPRLTAAFRRLLRDERPDLVHVQHWIRLSRDLVLAAAREGLPAVASLQDSWADCPIVFRVRPDTRAACDAPVGPHPCIACAGRVPPRTPWVPVEAAFVELGARQRDVARELELARVVTVPSAAHAQALRRHSPDGDLADLRVLPPLSAERLPVAPAPPDPRAIGRLLIGSWGQLARHKGADLLLDAASLAAGPRRFDLIFAGAEPDAAFKRALLERPRDAASVGTLFLGEYERERLAEHPVASVHVMVSTSRAPESWGLVLDEARDLGLPAVLPRAGAFVERAGERPEERGIVLYPPGDAAALGRVLAELHDQPARLARLRSGARAERERVPGREEQLAAWLAVYEEAVAAGAPEAPAEEWFEARLQDQALANWDAALSRTGPAELGLEER